MRILQKRLTKMALKIAKNYNIELDFTSGSIKHVEEILSDIHINLKEYKDLGGYQGIALEFGAYIITVMEKDGIKGIWMQDEKDFGEHTYPYYLEDGAIIFPYAWCLKRIEDGEGDNVWVKYKTIILDKEFDKSSKE